jgi:uncharacterized delta-60 repeat protein
MRKSLLFIFLFNIQLAFAQMLGPIDTTFNSGDVGYKLRDRANSPVLAIAMQPDDKVVLGGYFTAYNGRLANRLVRLNIDGTVDTTFNTGTGFNNIVSAIAVQPDNKILAAGTFTTVNGITNKGIIRLNADGSIDSTFINITNNWTFIDIISLKLQQDGKILVGGNCKNGTINWYLFRLNADGSIDNSFNSSGVGANSGIRKITLQNDGKILIGGTLTSYNGVTTGGLARLNINGSLDSTFAPVMCGAPVKDIGILSTGQIIIGGEFWSVNGYNTRYLAKLSSTGVLDTAFKIKGQINFYVNSVKIQNDDKIVFGGLFNYFNTIKCGRVLRIDSTGILDPTFDSGTDYKSNGTINVIEINAIGKFFIGGSFYAMNLEYMGCFEKLNNNGSRDQSIPLPTGIGDIIYTSGLQADGKIIIGGNFQGVNGIYKKYIARLKSDGTTDTTFKAVPNLGSMDYVLVQQDKKIIICGGFSVYNGSSTTGGIIRIDTNGTLDPSFSFPGFDHGVSSIIRQPDGKYLFGGGFKKINGNATPRNGVVRLLSNGATDPSFNVYAGTTSTTSKIVHCLALQPDGKIVVGGYFPTFQGVASNSIIRIESNGMVDTSFHSGVGFNNGARVYEINLQPDGKMLIKASYAYSYNGISISNPIGGFARIRLNTDGTLDNTYYHHESEPIEDIRSRLVQPDGKIIISGNFTSYNGTGRHRICRVLPCTVPTVSTSANLSICGSGAVVLSGSVSAGSVKWYADSVNLVPIATGSLFSTPILTTTTTYYVEGADYYCRSKRIPLRVTVLQPSYATKSFTMCSGSAISVGNHTYSSSGLYVDTLLNYLGCDSIISTQLTLSDTIKTFKNVSICANETYSVGSNTYSVAGNYVDSLVAVGGCDSLIFINLIVNSLPSLTISPAPELNCLNSVVGVTCTATGTFTWSGPGISSGANSNIADVTIPGIYSVTVTDANSCSNTGTVSVNSNTIFPMFSLTPTALSICEGATVGISANVTGTNSVSYLWDNSESTQSISVTPTVPTTYTATVTDNINGCYSTNTITINVDALPSLTIAGTNTVCVGSSSSFTINGAMAYTWSTGQATSIIYVSPTVTTTYSVSGTDMNGCINTQTVTLTVDNTCADVWPGDANSDGTADNLDVLELGLHYTQAGIPRATTSNSWQSYFATNWTGTITNGKNLNHCDCNGDGIINDDDTLAIYNNYGLTHAFKPAQTTTVNPQISIVPDQSMVVKGMWGTASVYLGDAATPINNINGVAFTVDFDQTLIEPNGIYLEYQNSFMDVGQNLHFRKLDFTNGKLFTASTHTLSNNVNGFGKIATLHYQILSSLGTDEELSIGVSQANQSDVSGTIVPLTSGTGTLMAIGASVGVKEMSINGDVLISPNPTNGLLNISFNAMPQNIRIELYNSLGALVLSEPMNNKTNTINTTGLSSGMYFMKVMEGDRVVEVKKVVRE